MTKFEELKNAKRNQTTVDDLQTLLSLSKKEKDYSLAMDVLGHLAELLRYLRQHDKVISLLENEIQEDFFSRKDDLLKVIDELVRTLLRTEDFIKLKSILFTRERFITNDHQKVMQKFYLAVCHEGLKEYDLAIENLQSIKDNISSSNLVSKYLKLSMLHLKVDKISKAKDYYDLALKFDYKKTNPIFYLAESDILYAMGDYINSLEKYQEYFIKSKNTRRYLDRYILLNIKLKHLDEAWRFYQEYLPSMKNLVSKNYRIVFYEAAMILAKELNNPFEIDKLEYLIQELQDTQPVLNQFDNVYRLLTIVFKDKRYLKERDVIHDLFKAIDSLYAFQKLLYVKKTDDHLTFYYYTKGLLMEKSPKSTEYGSTILEDILKNRAVNDLYVFDDLVSYSKELYKTAETQYLFVNGIERESSYDYFIVYSKDINDFDFQQKLILIANEILKKQLHDFDANSEVLNLFKNYRNLFDQEQIGFIKIEKGILHCLNQRAKDILKIDIDYLAFEEFQGMIQEELFLDDLLYKSESFITLKHSSLQKQCQLNIIQDEYIIYMTIKVVDDQAKEGNKNLFLDLPNQYQMLEDLSSCGSKSIIHIEIRNYLEYFKDYSSIQYQEKLTTLLKEIKTVSKNHFENIYMESLNIIYLVVHSIDRRVLKRIMDTLVKTIQDFDLRMSSLQVNTTFTKDNLLKLKHLVALTNLDTPYIFDNKNFRYNSELAKTLLLNIKNLLQKKEVPISFVGVGDWKTDKIAFFKTEIAAKAMLGEQASLERVLRFASLEQEWDYLIASQLVKEIKKHSLSCSFILSINENSLKDMKSLKRIVRKLETSQTENGRFSLMVDLSKIDNKESILEQMTFLKEKGFMLAGTNPISKINVQDIEILSYFDFLVLDYEDLNISNLMKFYPLIRSYEQKMILNHHDKTLKKSELERFDIEFVYGSKYGKYESGTIANLGRS